MGLDGTDYVHMSAAPFWYPGLGKPQAVSKVNSIENVAVRLDDGRPEPGRRIVPPAKSRSSGHCFRLDRSKPPLLVSGLPLAPVHGRSGRPVDEELVRAKIPMSGGRAGEHPIVLLRSPVSSAVAGPSSAVHRRFTHSAPIFAPSSSLGFIVSRIFPEASCARALASWPYPLMSHRPHRTASAFF
jgi:hypothetical protein